jgi:hypothetical protein
LGDVVLPRVPSDVFDVQPLGGLGMDRRPAPASRRMWKPPPRLAMGVLVPNGGLGPYGHCRRQRVPSVGSTEMAGALVSL